MGGYNREMVTAGPTLQQIHLPSVRYARREYLLFSSPEGTAFPEPDESIPVAIFGPDAVTGSLTIALTSGVRTNFRLYARSAYGVLSDDYATLSVHYDGVTAGPKPSRIANLRAFQSGTSVVLTWTIDPEYGASPNGFRVFRAEDLTSVIATVAYASPKRTYRWSEIPATDGLYRYTVRSYKDSVEDQDFTVVSVNYDKTGHAAPTGSLSLSQESA